MKLRDALIIIVLIVLGLAVLDVLVITHLQMPPRNVDMVIPSPDERNGIEDDSTGTTRT